MSKLDGAIKLLKAGEDKRAIRSLKRVAAGGDRDLAAQACMMLFWVYYENKVYNLGDEWFDRAVSLQPDYQQLNAMIEATPEPEGEEDTGYEDRVQQIRQRFPMPLQTLSDLMNDIKVARREAYDAQPRTGHSVSMSEYFRARGVTEERLDTSDPVQAAIRALLEKERGQSEEDSN